MRLNEITCKYLRFCRSNLHRGCIVLVFFTCAFFLFHGTFYHNGMSSKIQGLKDYISLSSSSKSARFKEVDSPSKKTVIIPTPRSRKAGFSVKPFKYAKISALDKFKERYEKRKKRLKESCDGQLDYKWRRNSSFIASTEDKFVVCVVQKAASTSWHKVIQSKIFPGATPGPEFRDKNYEYATKLSQETKDFLKDSPDAIRVLTVRHPFSRLVSGWNQKFGIYPPMSHTFMPEEDLKKYSSLHKPEENHMIAFRDFIRYIVETPRKKINNHFRSVEELCAPCTFPFDYIVKAETSHTDAGYVTQHLHVSISKGEKTENDEARIWKKHVTLAANLFSTVPREDVLKLLEIYKEDFYRFGYSFNLETNMVSFKE